MRIQKYHILPFAITIILFLIPFSWLKPGEMELGGDSSRLYFYDPFSYLHAETLYSVISSGIGGDAISYYALPHMALLAILRLVITPTILISVYNGIKLSMAFFFCYLIAKELIKTKESFHKEEVVEISAVLTGIFYLFSPILINSGWDRAILTHTQVFVNPMMFLLLLRYFVTRNIVYLLGALIITFIFSLNFSFIGAPSFFAFYPLSFIFLIVYTKYIKKTKISIRQLIIGVVVFLMLQAFHIIPHILSLFSAGSEYAGLFTDKTKFTRGLDYFTGIAPNIKVSISLLNLAQVRDIVFLSTGFIVFPAILIVGFLLNSTKNYFFSKYTLLLSGVFFLVTVFFATANITDTGFAFYKLLFYIPGFQMFRNFYGQWAFAFVFFYALLFSQSLAIILNQFKRYQAYLLAIYVGLILVVAGWPFINGSMVNAIHFQSKDVKQTIKMDPVYEKVLNFVRALPSDGKILSLPLVGPGYQVLAGKEGGAYIGPSTFSYLVGKSDFTGYDGLKPYGDFFLQSVSNKNYSYLIKLFSLLNIHYIFYNSDPYIYDNNFPYYPYDYVRSFLPRDQKSYKEFINQLPIDKDKKIDLGDKYHFYPIKKELAFPHIYATTETVYTTDPLAFSLGSSFGDQQHSTVFYFKNSRGEKDDIILEPYTANPLFLLKNNSHLHRHEPFIKRGLDDTVYPFAVLKEKFDLWMERNNHEEYIDLNFFYLSKRVNELVRWADEIPIKKDEDKWKEPKIWEFNKWSKYNSWEAGINRYKAGMVKLINWVIIISESKVWKEANKIKISEQLLQHQMKLLRTMKGTNRDDKEKKYLLFLIDNAFVDLFKTLRLSAYDPSSLQYDLLVPKGKGGKYKVYLEKSGNLLKEAQKIFIEVNGKILGQAESSTNNNDLIEFSTVDIGNIREEKVLEVVLHLPENFIEHSIWDNPGDINSLTDYTILKINNILGDNSGGIVKQITGWESNKQYLISFDYQTFGDDFVFKVYDKRLKEYPKKDLVNNVYLEKNLNSKIWKTHQSIVSADKKSLTGFIQILGNSEETKSELLIKNLSVVEMQYPKIFFKRIIKKIIGLGQKEVTSPHILFKKINPTKYKIEVTGAYNPYTLVFLEQFSKKWKLQDIGKNTNTFKGAISRFFANVGVNMISPFIRDKQTENNIVASYFNGEVKEGVHQKTFLAPNTFETWGKDSVADHKHFQVNGYANGWNIEPKDMDGKTSYTLILEMTAQKQLYPLLFISLLTFIFVLLYFFIRFFSVNGKTN